jgi:rhodanese-related sulfurtransferase
MKSISTKELKDRLKAGPVALFDVRGDIAYEKGHIPDAKTAPLGSLTFRVASLMKPDSLVVVYSNDKHCPMARDAVERLEGLKLENVHCYDAGIEGWKRAGLPLVESPSPKLQTRGPVIECRPVVVNRETAYGGAFKDSKVATESAGG